ncbi:MAG: DUF4097 domain-containing protein, partial [Opitutaceae bacterium]|nr:DUF4097 domain-containing protein [Opitutaceae bacterium]
TLAAAGDILLTASAGDLTLNGALTSATGGITLTADAGSIALNDTLTAAGDIALTADAGSILATAQITATGGLSANANAITGTLALAGVQTGGTQTYIAATFTGTGLLQTTAAGDASAAGDIVFNITNAATLSGAAGRIDSAAAFTATAGSFITDSAANTLTAAGDIAITATAGNLTLNGAVRNTVGDITLTADAGDITLNAVLTSTAGNITLAAAAGDITLNAALTSAVGDITLAADAGDITLNAVLTSTAGGITLAATNGGILLAGAGGIAAADALIANAADPFTVAGAANVLTAGGSIAITTAVVDGVGIVFNGALTSATGGITLATAGGDIVVGGRVTSLAADADVVFSTVATTSSSATTSTTSASAAAGGAGMTTIKSGASVELAGAGLRVLGGFTLEEGGGVSTGTAGQVVIEAAGREVILGARLGGGGEAGDIGGIGVGGAGFIGIAGVETFGTQSFATHGGDIEVRGLLKSGASSGTSIVLATAGADGAAAGMTTIRAGGGIEAAGGLVVVTGGLLMEENTGLVVPGAGGVVVDALGRHAVFHAALGGEDGGLSGFHIRNAGDILLSGVTTTGSQSYHFGDEAAMRLDGMLRATGEGSISIANSRTDYAGWATIFSTAPGGIHIETATGDIEVSRFNTMLAFDAGLPDATAGDIVIKASGGSVSLPNMVASHKIELTVSQDDAITLLGTHYQAAIMNCHAVYDDGSQTSFFPVRFSRSSESASTRIITGQNEARILITDGIELRAYRDGVVSRDTGRISAEMFQTMPAPDGSLFGALYDSGTSLRWLLASNDAVQNTIAANLYQHALGLAALEENMKTALASFMSTTDVANRITGATKDELASLGIFSRRPSVAEYISRGYYRGLFRQLIQSEERAPEMYRVVDGRISEANAKLALEIYRGVFMRANGGGGLVSRVPEIQAALQSCIHAFRSENLAVSDPAEFARFIHMRSAGNPDAGLVREFIEGARRLFAFIGTIGLTRNEIAAAKSVLLRPLRATGLPPGAIRDIIDPPPPAAAARATPPVPPPAFTLNRNPGLNTLSLDYNL